MSLPLNQVVVGDCTEVMQGWPADSIDLVVTSPPYWGLRDYGSETVRVWGGVPECEHEWDEKITKLSHGGQGGLPEYVRADTGKPTGGAKTHSKIKAALETDRKQGLCSKCGAWRGSLGLEPHPQLFIDHLVEICREIRRVLKPSGTFWLNLGDTYYGSGGKGGQYEKFMPNKGQPDHYRQSSKTRSNWLQPKQKLMMPSRIAIALQHDGWILRNDIIWHKPNHMPGPWKDRLTPAYEHVFLFAKRRRYYFDLYAIRAPHVQPDALTKKAGSITRGGQPRQSPDSSGYELKSNPLGKNPGDLWRIPTTPFPGAHFATFPPKLIEPIIKAGSPRWVCSRCGKPRIRITEPTPEYAEKLGKSVHDHKDDLKRGMRYDKVTNAEYVTTGWSDCGCGEKWVGGVVLDPFGGSGTVGQVARRLGRRFILIEIIPEYCKMAEQRVRGKYKPAPEGVTPFTQNMEEVK